jgi:hypothetical protein
MKIKAFFLFPEEDDIIIQLGEDPEVYENLIKDIALIKKQLRSLSEFELFYDSSNIDHFFEKAEALIDENLLSVFRNKVRIIFSNFSKNVSTTYIRKTDCRYINWNLNLQLTYSNPIISEIAETKHQHQNDNVILINISDAHQTNRDQLFVILDEVHLPNLPQVIHIPIANNEVEFAEWSTIFNELGFSLKDKTRFRMTTLRWKKQRIYKEIDTGYYWYFDYFHKENDKHFEVFDNQGNHLFEVSEKGSIIEGSRDNNKIIDSILH